MTTHENKSKLTKTVYTVVAVLRFCKYT